MENLKLLITGSEPIPLENPKTSTKILSKGIRKATLGEGDCPGINEEKNFDVRCSGGRTITLEKTRQPRL